jgi:hypothetical protein
MEQKVTKKVATTRYNTLVVAVGNGAANIVDDALKLQEYEAVGRIFVDTQSSGCQIADCLRGSGDSSLRRRSMH